jgi:cell division septum initiation protein DivIVA
MMEIFRILDELEILLKGSRKVPMTGGKSIIETSRFLDRVDRIRAILPEELETAKLIMAEKERIVSDACAEADKYLEHSKSHVALLVDDNEITRSARGAADQIIAQSEEIAAQIRRDANEYADGVLSHMEIVLRKGLETVLQGRDDIRDGLRNNDY